MHILLINPKNKKNNNYTIIPNIGLGYLASALLKDKHNVSILDCVKEGYDIDRLQRYLRKRKFNLVGINVFTYSINSVREYTRLIKNINKNVFIVVGGPHPTVEPIETLQILKEADFGFCGEGEVGFPELVKYLEKKNAINKDILNNIQNLIWRDNGRIICNSKETIEDLNKVPYPAWDLMRPQEYPGVPNGIFSKEYKVAAIIATRGCPCNCTFCAGSRISGNKIRMRDIENIIEEIKLLNTKFGIKEIHIEDDNFTQNRWFVKSFCEGLINHKINVWWACPNGVRLDTLDRELLKLMEKSGCYSLAVGIEFGSQRILNHAQKGLSLETIKEKINLIKNETKIEITGFFIIGYPEETINDIKSTISLAVDLNIDRANFFNFSPFPGSKIHEILKERGELKNINYNSLYLHNISYNPPGISKEKMRKLQRMAYLRFYRRPKILFKLVKEVKTLSQIRMILKKAIKIIFGI